MAATDTYITEAQKAVYTSAFVNGGKVVALDALIKTRAAGEIGDIYRFAKDIDSSLIPLKLWIANGVLSSATCDIGVYKPNGGAAIDDNCMDAALSIASASNHTEALSDVPIADMQKNLAELAGGDVTTYPAIDLGIKFTGAAQQSTTIVVRGLFLQR